jgi:hypothetical protein
MGVKSDLEAVKKALNDALSKLESAEKAYEEKKRKNIAALKKAEVAVSKIVKAGKAGGNVADDAKDAGAAIDSVMASEEKG